MSDPEKTYVLGKYLRMLRKDKNVKQDDVAKAIQVTRATYSHYENGRIIPPTEILAKLSSYYDVKLDKLVDMAVRDKSCRYTEPVGNAENSLDAEEILYYYQKMPDDDKQLIKMIIKDFYMKKSKQIIKK